MGESKSGKSNTTREESSSKINGHTEPKIIQNQYSPRCKNCSGYEEKILLHKDNEILGEIAEMDRHEIICRIAGFLGTEPSCLSLAEKMFNNIKYQITEYVLKHEFNNENDLSVQLAIWLEQKQAPELMQPLHSIISRYLTTK